MNEGKSSQPPPLWVLLLALAVISGWFVCTWYLDNIYSRWNSIANVHIVQGMELTGSRGPTRIGVSDRKGFHYMFGHDGGGYGATRFLPTEMGFNEEGFWIRQRFPGYGPSRPVFIGWRHVQTCHMLSAKLDYPPLWIIVHDQAFLDECEIHTQ